MSVNGFRIFGQGYVYEGDLISFTYCNRSRGHEITNIMYIMRQMPDVGFKMYINFEENEHMLFLFRIPFTHLERKTS